MRQEADGNSIFILLLLSIFIYIYIFIVMSILIYSPMSRYPNTCINVVAGWTRYAAPQMPHGREKTPFPNPLVPVMNPCKRKNINLLTHSVVQVIEQASICVYPRIFPVCFAQFKYIIIIIINQATLSNLKFTIIIFDEARIILNKASSPLNASECLNIQRIRKILKTLMPEGDDMFHPAMISMSTDR